MAGDTTVDTTGAETPPPILADPFPGIQATLDAIDADQRMQGWEVFRLDAAAAPVAQSQRIRLRVRMLVISAATAGPCTLVIGTTRYPFTVTGVPVAVPFPVLIERGTDISVVGDGQMYLLGVPE